MNNDTTAARCVALVENAASIAPVYLRHSLTAADRAKLFADGSIISVAPPMAENAVDRIIDNKREYVGGPSGVKNPANRAAADEILALGDEIKYGEAFQIVKKHNAHIQTAYKLVWNSRQASVRERQRHVITPAQAQEIENRGAA